MASQVGAPGAPSVNLLGSRSQAVDEALRLLSLVAPHDISASRETTDLGEVLREERNLLPQGWANEVDGLELDSVVRLTTFPVSRMATQTVLLSTIEGELDLDFHARDMGVLGCLSVVSVSLLKQLNRVEGRRDRARRRSRSYVVRSVLKGEKGTHCGRAPPRKLSA